MSDFFGTLEAQLREAALRPPRRLPDARPLVAAGAAAAMSLVAIAVALVFVVDRGPGPAQVREADPPLPPLLNPRVVAEGEAPVAGRWRIVSYESERLEIPDTGEVYQPAGLRCLGIQLLDGTEVTRGQFGGGCGEFAQTPGFGRHQHSVRDASNRTREILVYGRTPEEVSAVRIEAPGRPPIDATLYEGPPSERGDFYLAVVPPDIGEGRVNWLDERRNEGSRGLALMPP